MNTSPRSIIFIALVILSIGGIASEARSSSSYASRDDFDEDDRIMSLPGLEKTPLPSPNYSGFLPLMSDTPNKGGALHYWLVTAQEGDPKAKPLVRVHCSTHTLILFLVVSIFDFENQRNKTREASQVR